MPRRSPKSAERQRDPERTKAQILDAATAEFAAHGYAGARISAIATRAGVNQQLISYYFDGKEGLYLAISEQWLQRQSEIATPDTPIADQLGHYALESQTDPNSARLMAWSGLEYSGPTGDPDHATRSSTLQHSVDRLRDLQKEGKIPAEVDPACLLVMMMAASMATTTMPHVIEGLCRTDPASPEFARHYAEQVTTVARLLGLG